MKRSILLLLVLSFTLQLFSQTKMIINKNNGTSDSLNLSDIKNITFKTSISPIPINGLVAWYPFNGTVNDSSGYGNNGTNNGATPTTDRFGNAGKAYAFNGLTSYILIPNASQLNNIDSITLCCWVQSIDNGDKRLLTKGNANQYQYGIPLTSGQVIAQAWTAGGGDALHAASLLGNNNWHFVTAIVKSNTSAAIYVDGSLKSINTTIYGVWNKNGTGPLTIGAQYDGANNLSALLTGNLDDIRIYNRALNSTEIQALYNEK